MASCFSVWSTIFPVQSFIHARPQVGFSLKVLPIAGKVCVRVGGGRVHIKEERPSVSTGSKQLVEEMQDVWTKTDRMEDDRKQISLPFTPPAKEEVDHQSSVMSHSLQMLALLCSSLLALTILPTCPFCLLFLSSSPLTAEWWFVSKTLHVSCFHDVLLERFFSLPCYRWICSI